jgi:hypothetical protein
MTQPMAGGFRKESEDFRIPTAGLQDVAPASRLSIERVAGLRPVMHDRGMTVPDKRKKVQICASWLYIPGVSRRDVHV